MFRKMLVVTSALTLVVGTGGAAAQSIESYGAAFGNAYALCGNGAPAPGGVVTLQASGLPCFAPGGFAMSPLPDEIDMGFGTCLVQPSCAWTCSAFFTVAGQDGRCAVSMSIPANPALEGYVMHFQGLFIDPDTESPGLTCGVRVELGALTP